MVLVMISGNDTVGVHKYRYPSIYLHTYVDLKVLSSFIILARGLSVEETAIPKVSMNRRVAHKPKSSPWPMPCQKVSK